MPHSHGKDTSCKWQILSLNGLHCKETSSVIQSKRQSDRSTICFLKHKMTKLLSQGVYKLNKLNATNNVKDNIDISCL